MWNNKRPLVLYGGHVKELQQGDNISDQESNSIAKRAESVAEDRIKSSTIKEIKVVDSLPTDPEDDILYLVKE